MSADRTCHRTVTALPWLLNGRLEAVERRAVREHLIACPGCRAELARTRQALALFQAAASQAAGPAEAATAPAVAAAPFRTAAVTSGRPAVRALAIAAGVAGLVLAGGLLWLRSEDRQQGAAHVATTALRPVAAAPARASATRPAPLAQSPVPAAPVLVAIAEPAAPPAGRPLATAAASARRGAPRAVGSTVALAASSAAGNALFSTSFENGTIAEATTTPPRSAPISSSHFEAGLEHWTRNTGYDR